MLNSLRARNAADPVTTVDSFLIAIEVFMFRNFPQNK
jgi:hypothetical protein